MPFTYRPSISSKPSAPPRPPILPKPSNSTDATTTDMKGIIKTVSIVTLIVNLLLALAMCFALYRGIIDDSDCKSKIPLIIIASIWLISILIQIIGISFVLYGLGK